MAVLLFLESTIRLRTIFPKATARRRKYWILAECLAPAFWPAASKNASTAFSRSARAPKLLGSLTAVATGFFRDFRNQYDFRRHYLCPAAKGSAGYITSTAIPSA